MFRNFSDLMRENKAIGHHWFDADALRFFNTEIESSLLVRGGRQFFITSDRMELDDEKRYSIREVRPDGRIKTYGKELREHATVAEAIRIAEKAFR